MILDEPFQPSFFLKNPFLQTVLASFPLRAMGKNPMAAAGREMVLNTAEGVRLLGAYSAHNARDAQNPRPPKGLVLLLHGWEGSLDSTYILAMGRHLFGHGYDVFRLNLRDHGLSHHLNPGLFFATLFDEIFDAVKQVARLSSDRPFFIAGFSLGGNYALRIARHCANDPITNLRHVFSISPVLDPDKATDKIDADPVILKYFLKKWTRSLAMKQRLYPDRYDFTEALQHRSLRGITRVLLACYSDYPSPKAYFKAYSLLGSALSDNPIPTTIVTAADDPIIPVEDFFNLKLGGNTRLIVHKYGGHSGFVENITLISWCDRKTVELFDRLNAAPY